MAAYLNEQVVAADLTSETRWAAYQWCPMALAHGLHASRIDGSELVYNQPNTWLPDLLICQPEYAGQVLQAVRDLEEK